MKYKSKSFIMTMKNTTRQYHKLLKKKPYVYKSYDFKSPPLLKSLYIYIQKKRIYIIYAVTDTAQKLSALAALIEMKKNASFLLLATSIQMTVNKNS